MNQCCSFLVVWFGSQIELHCSKKYSCKTFIMLVINKANYCFIKYYDISLICHPLNIIMSVFTSINNVIQNLMYLTLVWQEAVLDQILSKSWKLYHGWSWKIWKLGKGRILIWDINKWRTFENMETSGKWELGRYTYENIYISDIFHLVISLMWKFFASFKQNPILT